MKVLLDNDDGDDDDDNEDMITPLRSPCIETRAHTVRRIYFIYLFIEGLSESKQMIWKFVVTIFTIPLRTHYVIHYKLEQSGII